MDNYTNGIYKYMVIRAYNDITSGTEKTDSISSALSACAIYLEDSDCFTVKIVDCETGKLILDYVR